MAQQNINIGTANAKAGDTLFDAFTKVEANTTEVYSDIAANAAAIEGAQSTHWFNDNDTATATTPIAHTGGATTYLTNNALGAQTTQYNPDSKARLFNTTTNAFDFSSLKIGDVVSIRVDILADTSSANQELDIAIDFAIGSAGAYSLQLNHEYYKTVSTGNPVAPNIEIYIGNDFTRLNPAKVRFASPNNASIVVNGWFYRIVSI